MSERDTIHDPNEPEFELGDVADDTIRNRPATGAAFAQSPQEVDLDWKGSSAATDFLGIEGETRVDEIPAAIGSGLDTSGSGGLPADSWLHDIEDVSATTGAQANGQRAENGARLEAIHEKVTAASGSSSGFYKLLAAAIFVLIGSAAGWWYWKKQHAASTTPAPVEVATKPHPVTQPKPSVPVKQPTSAPTEPRGTTPKPPVDGEPAPVVPVGGPTDPVAVEPVTPSTPDVAVIPETPDAPTTAITPTIQFPSPGAVEPVATTKPTESPATPSNFRVLPPSSEPIPGAVRRATDDDFANVWLESAVPLDAITGERRLRTINVGPVRVMLSNGEYFEGALYAVGQDRVWLDLDLGRISFEAATVRDITRIPVPAGASGKVKGLELSGLPHVEVLLPGGWIAGRLVGREGRSVTLVTDTGIRMVVETDEVRPITPRRTRVLGPVEKLGGLSAQVPAASAAAKKP